MLYFILYGIWFVLGGMGLFYYEVKAQTAKIDSLRKVAEQRLTRKQEDTTTVKTLNDLAYEIFLYNPVQSKEYAQQAKEMAERVQYMHGKLDAMTMIANSLIRMDSIEQAIKIYRVVVQTAQAEGFRKESAAALNGIGQAYLYQSRFDSAMVYLRQALKVLDTLNKPTSVAILGNIGAIFMKRAQFDSAMTQYMIALHIAEQAQRKDLQVQILGNIGNMYGDYKKYDKALEFEFQAVKLAEQLGNERLLAVLYSNIAGSYTGKQEYETALEYLRKATVIKEKLQMKSSLAYSYSGMADVYTRMKKHMLAIESMQKAMKIEEELGLTQQFIESNAKIVLDYIGLKDYAKAVQYGKKAFMLADTIPDFRFEKRVAAENLVFAYEGLGDNKEALYYQRVYTALQDSIYNQESAATIAEMQTKYDTELKDKEILQQQLTISNQGASLQQRNLLIFGLGSVLIVLGLLINRFRIKRRADEEIRRKNEEIATLERTVALERERQRISQDLHDEIGPSITKILIMSNLTMPSEAASSTEAQETGNELAKTAQEVIKAMANVIWLTKPENDSLESLTAYIREYASEYFSATKLEHSTHLAGDIPDYSLPGAHRRNIFLTVKEALNNVVKHARASTVSIDIAVRKNADKQEYHITISDNGIGFEQGTTRRFGNGLKNMQQRIEEIGGTFRVENAVPTGTNVEIMYPIREETR